LCGLGRGRSAETRYPAAEAGGRLPALRRRGGAVTDGRTPELIDSHCHLDFPEFAPELDAVVARARAAGVGRMLTICTRLSKFDQVLAVAEKFDRMFCSVGVHPHEAANEA